MKLIPLGTNGYYPSHGRQTMSYLLLTEQQAVLLDAGTGTGRLIEPTVAAMVEGYESLDIVLSHYHLDHVAGLSYLPAVWDRGRVRIHGPAPPLVDSDPEMALGRLLSPPLFPATLDSFPTPVEIRPVRNTELAIGELRFTFWRQPHPGGSVGMRIGDDIAYMTDTSVESSNLDFASDVKLLIHELWLTDDEAGGEVAGHSTLSAVAAFAAAAGADRLLMVHHNPRRTPDEVLAMAESVAEKSGLPVSPGEEATPIEIG